VHDCAHNKSSTWSVNPLPAEVWERAPYWGCAKKKKKKVNLNYKVFCSLPERLFIIVPYSVRTYDNLPARIPQLMVHEPCRIYELIAAPVWATWVAGFFMTCVTLVSFCRLRSVGEACTAPATLAPFYRLELRTLTFFIFYPLALRVHLLLFIFFSFASPRSLLLVFFFACLVCSFFALVLSLLARSPFFFPSFAFSFVFCFSPFGFFCCSGSFACFCSLLLCSLFCFVSVLSFVLCFFFAFCLAFFLSFGLWLVRSFSLFVCFFLFFKAVIPFLALMI